MNQLAILIVIDTAGALASGSAIDNAYLVDTNGFLGSWNEGTPVLETICQDGQTIDWSLSPVAPDAEVEIAGFSGAMVDRGICRPAALDEPADTVWSGRVESRGQFAAFDYRVALSIGGKAMSLEARIKVV